MPFKRCTVNGRSGWKYGDEGKCYPGEEGKKKAIAQAIAISKEIPSEGLKLAKKKISFDYDGVASTAKGKEMIKKHIEAGDIVYIISARSNKIPLLKLAQDLGIADNRVYATGSNKAKVEKVNSLDISTHVDNNENVIKDLKGKGDLFK